MKGYRHNVIVGGNIVSRKALELIEREGPEEILFKRQKNGVLYDVFTATESKHLIGYTKCKEKNKGLEHILHDVAGSNVSEIRVIEKKDNSHDVYFLR